MSHHQKCWLLLLLTALPFASSARQSDMYLWRIYKAGEILRYRLTTNVEHNGKWQSVIVAECELTTKDSAGIPYEEVRWLSKKVYTAKDTTDHQQEIDATPAYRISLSPKGRLDLPPIKEAGMTGEITDFNTFYVAISPKLGIAHLHTPQDSFKKPDYVQGNFANGKDILLGQDCLEVTNQFKTVIGNEAILLTSFLPPASACLKYLTADMQTPVAGDTINNFQMVRKSAGDKVNVFFGKEVFLITSHLRTGKNVLTKATMDNTLTLRLKLNCNADYSACQTTIPFTIRRTVELQLLQ